ncbi:hypothetical protein NM688_g1071 [Phlebia brevispora]|uniref:Uncharacterized protein n=1 Tax=Phlebia brevispora TaxID=194682 RepID=A0ACC1TCS0_9APHY|nr:hypothetical protein NM688_g1071 [Phlebia brevispora]
MAPIRIGFIGLSTQGWASTEVVPPLFHPLLASKYTLTALCTRSEASATAAAKKYSELAGRTVKPYYGKDGVQGIVHDPEVDMVGVTVKMPDHFDLVMAVIDAGKDLFVEWTPGSSYEQTVRIAEAAKRKGIRVLVGGQANQGVAINKVKELIEGGKIGRVLSTTAILSANEETLYWGPKRKEWARYNLDINNGMLPRRTTAYMTN